MLALKLGVSESESNSVSMLSIPASRTGKM